MNATRLTIWYCLVFLLMALLPVSGEGKGRYGEIRLTDGTVYEGEIIIRGDMRLVTWAEEELGIEDEEDLEEYATAREGVYRRFWGRERTFDVEAVDSIKVESRPDLPSREKPPERMERKWDWKEHASFEDKRSEISDEKEYIGDPFPVRELQAVVTFTSGETLSGKLHRTAVYIYPEGDFTAKKFILRSKEKGEEGDSFEDLIHIKSIRFLEEGREFPDAHRIQFKNPKLDDSKAVWTVTRESFTRVSPEPVADAADTVAVSGVYGEGLFLAIRKNGTYYAGWKDRADDKLLRTAKKYVQDLRIYYNERKLLGVYDVPDSHDVLTLVRLRRHVPEISVRENEPERFGLDEEASLEFFRLAVWRWRYHPDREEMILVERGSFFRKELPERGMETPPAAATEALWIGKEEGQKEVIVIDQELE